jgi:glycosyltransferase involved in cell wall biosynthesis
MSGNSALTFIIPTIGRETLSLTLQSLKNQTITNWKAIVIFDGIEPNISETDPRITIIKTPIKLGQGYNSAGLVRNYGIKFVNTEWVAFVDDDDSITPNYIESFLSELWLDPDVIIFRMTMDDRVCPSIDSTNFFIKNVGISFAVKTELVSKFIFIPSIEEDFEFLDKVRLKKYKIVLSPYITYTVNKYNSINNPLMGKRGFVNY